MSKELVRLTSVSKCFPPSADEYLSDISLSIYQEDCIVVSGKNGSGKTLLMNIIAGLEQPTRGTVHITAADGIKTGLVFQDADAQILGDTVEEDILFGARHIEDAEKKAEKLNHVLNLTGLAEKRYYPSRSLSGGEKRRLAVAGVLMLDADIIIFDEPFANLDFEGVVQVVHIIEELKRQQKVLIILTHELEKILALANRLILLKNGSIVYDGIPEEALHSSILHSCGIRNPLGAYTGVSDLIWNMYGP